MDTQTASRSTAGRSSSVGGQGRDGRRLSFNRQARAAAERIGFSPEIEFEKFGVRLYPQPKMEKGELFIPFRAKADKGETKPAGIAFPPVPWLFLTGDEHIVFAFSTPVLANLYVERLSLVRGVQLGRYTGISLPLAPARDFAIRVFETKDSPYKKEPRQRSTIEWWREYYKHGGAFPGVELALESISDQ